MARLGVIGLAVVFCGGLSAVLLGACKRDTTISRDLGAACRSTADCTTRCLPDPTWPNGFCSLDCMKDTDCPTGSVCIDTSDGDVCLFSCMDDAECDFLNGSTPNAWKCLQRESSAGLNDLVCAPGSSMGSTTDEGAPDAF